MEARLLQQQVLRLSARLTRAKAEAAAAQGKLHALQQQVAAQEQALSSKDSTIAALQAEVTRLQSGAGGGESVTRPPPLAPLPRQGSPSSPPTLATSLTPGSTSRSSSVSAAAAAAVSPAPEQPVIGTARTRLHTSPLPAVSPAAGVRQFGALFGGLDRPRLAVPESGLAQEAAERELALHSPATASDDAASTGTPSWGGEPSSSPLAQHLVRPLTPPGATGVGFGVRRDSVAAEGGGWEGGDSSSSASV